MGITSVVEDGEGRRWGVGERKDAKDLDQGPQEVGIPLAWVGTEEVPVHLANQFVCQFNQDEFILTVGQMVPPAFLGTQEERMEQAEGISYVPIRPLARLSFTRARLVELVATLQANLDQYDRYQEELDVRMTGGDEND